MGKQWKQWQTLFWVSKITPDSDCSHGIKRCLPLGRKTMTKLDSLLKSRHITLPTKVCIGQSYGFSSSHVWIWELDNKEGRAPKNQRFLTVVLEKTAESPWTARRWNQSVLNKPWILFGRTDAEAAAPIFWAPDANSWFIGKDPDVGEDWRQKEKTVTGWDGSMAPQIRWTWTWAHSRRW